MNDQELFEVWKGKDRKESDVYKLRKKEVVQLAQKKSLDIFYKIERNIYVEGGASIIATIVFPFFFIENALFFWIGLFVMIAALLVSVKVYVAYLKDLKGLKEASLVTSLEKKVSILRRYVKQLYVLIWVFAPLGFLFGFSFALDQNDLQPTRIMVLLGISVPFFAVMMWLYHKYIDQMYGKHLRRVEKIYEEVKG